MAVTRLFFSTTIVLLATLLDVSNAAKKGSMASPIDENCEACGLLMWRLEVAIAMKAEELAGWRKSAAASASKPTTVSETEANRLKSIFGEELSLVAEAAIVDLPNNRTLTQCACRSSAVARRGSALRGAIHTTTSMRMPHGSRREHAMEQEQRQLMEDAEACRKRVATSGASVISAHQDELLEASLEGRGAGETCSRMIQGCTYERATWLLSLEYSDEICSHVHQHHESDKGMHARLDLCLDLDESVGYQPGFREALEEEEKAKAEAAKRRKAHDEEVEREKRNIAKYGSDKSKWPDEAHEGADHGARHHKVFQHTHHKPHHLEAKEEL
jgi:hypothetical protein